MKDHKKYTVLLISICTILVLVNGFEENEYLGKKFLFTVDTTTVYLVLIAIIPFAWKYLHTIKFGDWEARFQNSTYKEQVFIFLEGIANHSKYTYYSPREDETKAGEAFYVLAKEAMDLDQKLFEEMLLNQLNSKKVNQFWFATENIGHFKISSLRNELPKCFENLDPNVRWEKNQLNTLWAYSRFDDYKDLQSLYLSSKDIFNLKWITEAYRQMIKLHPEEKEIIKILLEQKRIGLVADQEYGDQIFIDLKNQIDKVLKKCIS